MAEKEAASAISGLTSLNITNNANNLKGNI